MTDISTLATFFNMTSKQFILFLILIMIITIWDLIWKVISLWKAAKKRSIVWFIVLIITNTAGILPILYIFVFSKMKKPKKKSKKK